MRPPGKPLGVRVKNQYRQRDWRKPEREAIELTGSKHKDSAGNDNEGCHESGSEMTGGQGARARAGISCIDRGIGQAIKCHRCGTCGNHGHDDPDELVSAGETPGGEHGPAQGEREGKNGVLPFNHLERHAEIVKNAH